MHEDWFVRGKGRFWITQYVPTDEKSTRRFPLLLTTRILSHYHVGTATRRTANTVWHAEDVLEIHSHDAELRGIGEGDSVHVASRKGAITLHAKVTDHVPPGIVYTTFHHPDSAANASTTESSDWATNCPEYKVTAVEVRPADCCDSSVEGPMQAEALVRMANDIAHFFAAYPEADAIEGVRDHIEHFWDPAMRKELLSVASGLTPTSLPLDALVLRAIEQLRQTVNE